MITLDINEQHQLALVDTGKEEDNPRYKIVGLSEAPPLPKEPPMAHVYLRQAHYVASHKVHGLLVVDLPVPKEGWRYR